MLLDKIREIFGPKKEKKNVRVFRDTDILALLPFFSFTGACHMCFLPLLPFSPFYMSTLWVLPFPWLFAFLSYCSRSSSTAHLLFIAFHCCMRTISFIFGAFYTQYKTTNHTSMRVISTYWYYCLCF